MSENIVALAADHAGYELKTMLLAALAERGAEALDLGTHGGASVDYPDMAAALATALGDSRADRGVLDLRHGDRNQHRCEPLPARAGGTVPRCHDRTSGAAA